MNILIVNTQEFNPLVGGVERISASYANELQKLGHNVWFAACLRSCYSKDYIPAAPQIMLPDEEYDTEKNVSALSNFILENNIHIIHNQAGNIEKFTRLCKKASNRTECPLISAIHTDPLCNLVLLGDFFVSNIYCMQNYKAIFRMLKYPFRINKIKRRERKIYRSIIDDSDVTIMLSPTYKKTIQELIGRGSAKIDAIPNWLPFSNIEDPQNKEKVILYVGRIDFEHKRVDRLISIWEKINVDFPDWCLRIIGDGPMRGDIEAYVREKGIPRIEFKGFCDPRKEYQKAEILCQTSTIEGLSMVLIEGMAHGCIPVAYGSYQAIYDVIDSGKNGYIIKPFSQKEYIKILRKLMLDSKLRTTIRKEAMNIKHRFQKEDIINKWLSIYNKCIEETK